jgi:hypothetical protein
MVQFVPLNILGNIPIEDVSYNFMIRKSQAGSIRSVLFVAGRMLGGVLGSVLDSVLLGVLDSMLNGVLSSVLLSVFLGQVLGRVLCGFLEFLGSLLLSRGMMMNGLVVSVFISMMMRKGLVLGDMALGVT